MIPLKLNRKEIDKIQYILLIQGSLEQLELVEKIFKKINVDRNEKGEDFKIDFDISEIKFMKIMIDVLDKNKQLYLESLSLVRKILNIKGDIKNG